MKVTLNTDRLILRPWNIDDAEDMFLTWANDEEVCKYLTWNAHSSVDVTKMIISSWIKEYEKEERINFAIVLKDTNKLIGGIDVVGYLENVPVIGYNLGKKYWNNGYMSEACKCVIEFLFSLGHKMIKIDARKENIGSIRVIEKCGGKFIRTDNEYLPLKNINAEINRYIVTKE